MSLPVDFLEVSWAFFGFHRSNFLIILDIIVTALLFMFRMIFLFLCAYLRLETLPYHWK